MKDYSFPGFSSVVKLFREINQLQLTRNLDYHDMMSGNLHFKTYFEKHQYSVLTHIYGI